MDIERFGEIIDKFIDENDIQMVIELPAGSHKAEIKDNCEAGPVLQMYIMLRGLVKVFDEFRDLLKEECTEGFIDEVMKMIKEEILEER